RAALLKSQLDHRALFTTQMLVVRSHRNTLPSGKCCTSDLSPPLLTKRYWRNPNYINGLNEIRLP
ncbi:MAG: hypothetical protein WBO95_18840, partial [Candidatus Dechloromonas phosphoritropha]